MDGKCRSDTVRLFEDILKSGADLRIKVTGRSMAPFLKTGEKVMVRRVPALSLRKGDLILYRTADHQPVLHRIIGKKRSDNASRFFLTKGDATATADNPVSDERVLGKVMRIERSTSPGHICHIDMDSPVSVMRNRLTALLQLYSCSVSGRIARRILSTFRRFAGSSPHF